MRALRRSGATLLAVLAALVVVAAVGGTLLSGRLTASSPLAPQSAGILGEPLRIATAREAGIACPTSAAFSPDGTQVVVLGTRAPCPSGTPDASATTALAIYDAASGALNTSMPLDVLLPFGRGSGALARFANLGWSPDGETLAVLYTVLASAWPSGPDDVLDSGLLRINLRVGGAQVQRGDGGYFGTRLRGFPLWQVALGSEVPAQPLAPGLTYAWDAAGHLAPLIPLGGALETLPATAGPRYPVGNPAVGEGTFSLWQPGVVLGPTRSGGQQATFITHFAAWAPGGRVVTLLSRQVALRAPGQMVRGATALVPARDAALERVRRAVGPAGAALVAWNPAGTALAAVDCTTSARALVEVFSTALGQEVGAAPLTRHLDEHACAPDQLSASADAYAATPLVLRWAPAGDRLLLLDAASAELTLWSVTPLRSAAPPLGERGLRAA